MTITGPDLSHHQGSPDFAAIARAGHSFVVLKATEGVGYTDPQFAANRAKAHAAGLLVGIYAFGRFGPNEAAYFLSVVGGLRAAEFPALDQEVPSSVGWCKAWLDAVYAATGVRPLIYMNQSASTGLGMGDWSQVAADYGLWLAKYDGSQAQPSVPYWGGPAMKQFTDAATVPGVAGKCDLNVFYGTREQLLAYGIPGGDMANYTDWSQTDKNNLVNDILHFPLLTNVDGQKVSVQDVLNAIEGDSRKLLAGSGQPGTVDAQTVADLVIAQLGQRINTPPSA